MNIVNKTCRKADTVIMDNTMYMEPAFIDSHNLVNVSNTEPGEKVIDYMFHHIGRCPSDLQSHLKRLDIYRNKKNADGIYGALLDLFIVLEKKGLPLRKRLLTKFYIHLKPHHRLVLTRLLTKTATECAPIPYVKESALSDGRSGILRLLTKQSGNDALKDRDIVEDARDLIDSGQIEQAQTRLKQALLTQPQREDISRELLEIIKYSHDLREAKNILQSTKTLPLALRKQWQELVILLEN